MVADTKDAEQAEAVRSEIISMIVKAWRRGKLLPRCADPVRYPRRHDVSCRSRATRGHDFSCRCSTIWAGDAKGDSKVARLAHGARFGQRRASKTNACVVQEMRTMSTSNRPTRINVRAVFRPSQSPTKAIACITHTGELAGALIAELVLFGQVLAVIGHSVTVAATGFRRMIAHGPLLLSSPALATVRKEAWPDIPIPRAFVCGGATCSGKAFVSQCAPGMPIGATSRQKVLQYQQTARNVLNRGGVLPTASLLRL
jgi:hypothetical protein